MDPRQIFNFEENICVEQMSEKTAGDLEYIIEGNYWLIQRNPEGLGFAKATEMLRDFQKAFLGKDTCCLVQVSPGNFLGWRCTKDKVTHMKLSSVEELGEGKVSRVVYKLLDRPELILEIHWQDCFPEKINLSVKCFQKFRFARSLYSDIQKLKEFLCVEKGEVESWSNESPAEFCRDHVDEFIQWEVSLNKGQKVGIFSEGLECFREVESQKRVLENCSFYERTDLDFLDRLWEFLKLSSDHHDLKHAFKKVLRKIQHQEFLPIIGKNKETTLGVILNEWVRVAHMRRYGAQGMTEEAIWDQIQSWEKAASRYCSKPLDVIIEVAFNKIYNDLHHYLVDSKLLHQLEPPFEIEEKLDFLEKTSALLEIAVGMRMLNFPSHSIRSVLGEAKEDLYKAIEVSVPCSYKVPENAQKLTLYCEKESTSTHKFFTKRSVFCQNQNKYLLEEEVYDLA